MLFIRELIEERGALYVYTIVEERVYGYFMCDTVMACKADVSLKALDVFTE